MRHIRDHDKTAFRVVYRSAARQRRVHEGVCLIVIRKVLIGVINTSSGGIEYQTVFQSPLEGVDRSKFYSLGQASLFGSLLEKICLGGKRCKDPDVLWFNGLFSKNLIECFYD